MKRLLLISVLVALAAASPALAFRFWHHETPVWQCVGVEGRSGYLECQETRPASPRYGFEIEGGLAILKVDGGMLFACRMNQPLAACRDFRIR